MAKSAFWDRAFAVVVRTYATKGELPMEQIKGTRSHISAEAGSPTPTTTLSASKRMKGHENFFCAEPTTVIRHFSSFALLNPFLHILCRLYEEGAHTQFYFYCKQHSRRSGDLDVYIARPAVGRMERKKTRSVLSSPPPSRTIIIVPGHAAKDREGAGFNTACTIP